MTSIVPHAIGKHKCEKNAEKMKKDAMRHIVQFKNVCGLIAGITAKFHDFLIFSRIKL